jgi:phage terminase large subunit GpA-like protein
VSLCCGAQIGKTVIATVFCLGSQDLDPTDFLYVHPTEDNARRWSKLKLAPMVRGSPRLRVLFPERSRDGADSVLFKERADARGSILISGANSPATLSQVSMPRQVQDDLAKWVPNAAGDPEGQADSRSSAFDFAKVLKISTPLVLPGCRITKAFEAGSQEVPYVSCPHCGHEQTLDIENFLDHIDEDRPERSAFACIDCGALIEDHHRPAMLRKARWVARNPAMSRYHRSFAFWAAHSPMKSLEFIARSWISARGEPDAEKTFANDVAGKAYQVKGEAPPAGELRDRAALGGRARGMIPHGGLVLTCGVDVNGDWLNWQVVAWSRDHRSFVVDYGRFDGAIVDAKVWEKLDALLASTWEHDSGQRVGLDLLAIDGNAWTEDVWTWAKKHPTSKVIMVRGVDGDDKPLLARVKKERARRTGKILAYQRRFYNFATSILKWSLYRRLGQNDPGGAGYVGFPAGLPDAYFDELTVEKRVEKRLAGRQTFGWDCPTGARNEALDTILQAEAAAIKFGVRDMPPALWDRLEAERAPPPADREPEPEHEPTAASPVPVEAPSAPPAGLKPSGSFIGGRRKGWL